MIHEYNIRILPEQVASEQDIKKFISREKGLDIRTINAIRVLKQSIDARQKTIFVNLSIRIYVNEMPQDDVYVHTTYHSVEGKPQVIVVGAGPGGLFASLRLIELGLRPVIVERGKNVHERKKDIALISRNHKINPESNYCFGEGGAGGKWRSAISGRNAAVVGRVRSAYPPSNALAFFAGEHGLHRLKPG